MDEAEAERIARTEALFREVNERIAETAARFQADETKFVCECADPACTERVGATLAEYERVRDEPVRFLLARGHRDERVETLVERRGEQEVVEKCHPRVAPLVRRLDPRRAA